LIGLGAWNLFTLALYGADKARSKSKRHKKKRRIRERTLLLCAFLMGGAGAALGMCLFRHKTAHLKFRLLVPLSLAFNMAVAAAAYFIYFTK
jgi:uncharacterized membrane protein YsdA (DUF1294 family)